MSSHRGGHGGGGRGGGRGLGRGGGVLEGEGEDGEEEEASPLLECFFQTSVRNANFRVQPHSSPEEAARTEQLYVALDQQLQSLLAGEGGSAAAASAKERATFLAESMGRTAPVASSPEEQRRAWPKYWFVLNWAGKLGAELDSTLLFSLASLEPRAGVERGIYDAAATLFAKDIIGPAAESDSGLLTEVMRTVLVGDIEPRKTCVKYLQRATCDSYSLVVARAILFAFRCCALASDERQSPAGSQPPLSPVEAAVLRLAEVAGRLFKEAEVDDRSQPQAKKQKQQQKQQPAAAPSRELTDEILAVFHALLQERVAAEGRGCGSCTLCTAAAGSPPPPRPPPASSVSNATVCLPLLVAYVRASMVSCTAGQYSIRKADGCRASTVPLLYAGKAFVLYRLAHRKQSDAAGSPPALPLAHDEPAKELLRLLRDSDSPFQRLVVVAATARRQSLAEERVPIEFTRQESMFAHHVESKWIAEEAPHLAATGSQTKAAEVLDQVLSPLCGQGPAELRTTALAPPLALDPDSSGRCQPLLFGDNQGGGATTPSTERLASLLYDWDRAARSKSWSNKAMPTKELLRKAIIRLALAVYFDLGIGPRVSELTDLLAVPYANGSLQRSVSLAQAEGPGKLVRLHVSSLKNGRSDLAFLSERLSALMVVYLAKVRALAAARPIVPSPVSRSAPMRLNCCALPRSSTCRPMAPPAA